MLRPTDTFDEVFEGMVIRKGSFGVIMKVSMKNKESFFLVSYVHAYSQLVSKQLAGRVSLDFFLF